MTAACRHCPASFDTADDLHRHTGRCPGVRFALDPAWWPEEADALKRRNRDRVLKRYQPDRAAINRANANQRRVKATRKGGYWVHGKRAQKAVR